MSKRLWTVDQFEKYLLKQESRGDIMYNLSDENIELANLEEYQCTEDTNSGYFKDDLISKQAYDELEEEDKQYFKLNENNHL